MSVRLLALLEQRSSWGASSARSALGVGRGSTRRADTRDSPFCRRPAVPRASSGGFKLIAALVALMAASAPLVVRADAEAGRFHDARARRFFSAGRYEAAISEFFLSHRHAPNAGTLHNIAVCFRLLRRWDEAYLHYTEYLEQAAPDDERRASAERALAEIEPRVARVRVVTDPPGATLFVDRREAGSYGRAPRLLAVPAGERSIEVSLEGYRPAVATVEAVVGQQTEVTLELLPITGTLSLSCNVDAAVVVRAADGEVIRRGRTPFEARIPPSTYVVELSAEGHVSRRELVALDADQVLSREVRLEANPVPTGELTVTSNVAGAIVQIDGGPVGFTPLALPEVPVGNREVVVRGEGMESWLGQVSVTDADHAWLTVSLSPAQTATHSDATWVLGGAGLGTLALGGVFAGLAFDAERRFAAGWNHGVAVGDAREHGLAFAVSADVAFALGGAALLVSTIFFVVEELTGRARTTGAVTRRPR